MAFSSSNGKSLDWSVGSWKSKKALQLPEYPDETELNAVLETLESFPPLVLASEIRALEERLANAAAGNAFLLQGGDCAESFKEFSADKIFDTFNTLAQMSTVLMFGGQLPVVMVGRMAGRFAKPRSTTYEEKDGLRLPIYRGDSINGYDFNRKSRTPDPQRVIKSYNQSGVTLNVIRALVSGGHLPSIENWLAALMRHWDLWLQQHNPEALTAHQRYNQLMNFGNHTSACFCLMSNPLLERIQSLASATIVLHTCLGLVSVPGNLMVPNGEFLRGVADPIGIKVSDKMGPKELVDLVAVLNPNNKPGRVTAITRTGAGNLRAKLPYLIRAVGEALGALFL